MLELIVEHQAGMPVLRKPLNHYALTRLIDEIIGAQPLRQAATAPDLAERFELTAG